MRRVNIDGQIKGLDGEDTNLDTMNRLVSNILQRDAQSPDPVKGLSLAQRFFAGGDVELDESDLKLVRTAVERSAVYDNIAPVLIKGQIMQALDDAPKVEDGA